MHSFQTFLRELVDPCARAVDLMESSAVDLMESSACVRFWNQESRTWPSVRLPQLLHQLHCSRPNIRRAPCRSSRCETAPWLSYPGQPTSLFHTLAQAFAKNKLNIQILSPCSCVLVYVQTSATIARTIITGLQSRQAPAGVGIN